MRCWNQLVCDVQLGRKCPGSRSDCKLVVGVMNHVSRVDAQNFFVADFAMPSSFGSKTVVALQKRKSTGMHLERVKMAEVEERAECMNGRLVESRRTVVAGGTVALGVCSCIVILDLYRSEEIPESHNAVHEAVEVEEAVGQKSWVGRWRVSLRRCSLGSASIAGLILIAGRPICGRYIWLRSTEGGTKSGDRGTGKLRAVLRLWCAILPWIVGTPRCQRCVLVLISTTTVCAI